MNRRAACCTFFCLTALAVSANHGGQSSLPFQAEPSARAFGLGTATGIASVDLNGDKITDLIVLSEQVGALVVLLNVEGKSFSQPTSGVVAAGPSSSGTAIGDFNEDGKQDVAISHQRFGEIWLLLGKGDGTFESPIRTKLPVEDPRGHMLVAADVNKDKHLDLIETEAAENKVVVLVGNGRGAFTIPEASQVKTERYPYFVATGDFDSDGNLDFAAACWFGKALNIFLGDGRGGFKPAPGSPITGLNAPIAVAAADLDGDKLTDLVIGHNASSTLQILKGDGRGSFKMGAIADLESEGACAEPVIADLNGDGKLDVVATAGSAVPTFSYWLNQGSGKFGAPKTLNCPLVANTICVSDFNADGAADIAAGTWNQSRTFIWFGKKGE